MSYHSNKEMLVLRLYTKMIKIMEVYKIMTVVGYLNRHN